MHFLEIKQNITFLLYILWKNICTLKKFPQTNKFCGNQIKASLFLLWFSLQDFPKVKNFQKYPKIWGFKNKHICHTLRSGGHRKPKEANFSKNLIAAIKYFWVHKMVKSYSTFMMNTKKYIFWLVLDLI